MKIVAFLQNMWVRPGQVESVSRSAPTSDQRERMIHYALFAGCATGRRLKSTFGDVLCQRIRWQEASPIVAGDPKTYFPPDPAHIGMVLKKHQPKIVLCFTRQGESAIRSMLDGSVLFIPCVHPACRAADTMDRLRRVAGVLLIAEA